jgi:hypothetical protein
VGVAVVAVTTARGAERWMVAIALADRDLKHADDALDATFNEKTRR